MWTTWARRYAGSDIGDQRRVSGQTLAQALDNYLKRIWHDNRKPLRRWFESQERYAEVEAKRLVAAQSEDLSRFDRLRKDWLVVTPMVMPIYLLLVRGLVLDGWNGWYYTFHRTAAEIMLSLRLLEHKFKG